MSAATRLVFLALCGATVGLGCWLMIATVIAALRRGSTERPGWPPAGSSATHRQAVRVMSGAVTPVAVGGLFGLAVGAALGIPVLVALGGAAGWLTVEARRGVSVAAQNELGEAIASWCEIVRQELDAGQPLKTAVAVSCEAPQPALSGPLRRLRARLDRQPLPAALTTFRADVAHPAAGAIVTALVLAYQHGAGDLARLMTEQVEVTRHRVAILRDTHAARARHRRSMTLLLGLFALSTAGVLLIWPAMLAPYRTAWGQLVLALIIGDVAVAVRMQLRLSRPDEPPDFFGGAT